MSSIVNPNLCVLDEEEDEKFSGHVMASSIDLLTKINDEFLTCQICFETYTRPKSLNCQHTFCLKCLEEYNPPNNKVVVCPTCRSEQPLTVEGINGLKDNFFISSMSDMLKTVKEIRSEDKDGTSLMCDTCDHDNRKAAISRCLDCTDFLCSECSIWHIRTKLTRRHKIVSLTEFESGMHNQELKSRAKIYCMIHDGEAAKIYCQSCQCPICHECVECGHARHRRCSLKEEVLNQGRQIENLLKTAKEKTGVLRTLQSTLKEIKITKKKERDQAEAEIEKTCEIFINAIHRRKQELVDELHNMHASEVKHINADEDSVEMQLSSLVSCTEFSRKVLEYGTPKEVLGLNNQMTQILHQLLETHPAMKYHKTEQTDVILFDTNPDASVRVIRDNLGRLNRQEAAFDENTNKVLRQLDSFCATESGAIERRNGQRAITQRAESTAETRLLVQLGKQGIGDGEFESTPNLAVNSVNEIITADFDGAKIQIFDPQGNFKDSFVTEVNKRMCKPAGIAILNNDDIAVCCEDQVHIWTHEGKGVLGFGKGFFGNCSSIAVNADNHLVVADVGKHCVSVHTNTGKLITQFGAQGKGESKLIEPRYVACDSLNNIIVSDGGDCSIKKFSAQGEFLLSFGSEGPENGQFQGPRGICADEHDNILVADCWNHRVDLFTQDGCFLRHIATGADSLHFPWCLALTSNGKMVLSEDYSWSVKMFELPEYRNGSSISSMEEMLSPNSFMPDFEQLAQMDIQNILSNKVSWWLTSPGPHEIPEHQVNGVSNGSIHNTIATSSLSRNSSKTLSSKKSSSSDSDLSSMQLPPPPPPPPGADTQQSNDVIVNGLANGGSMSLKTGGNGKVCFSGKITSLGDPSPVVAMVNGT
ncbi:tripartite motif-containing protein 2-like isoform X3 [Clavelina lepadiformis]|uniref:RING-type E3 ubiquitin transferase n=1 Tax=Clavelina lepadiformis TaxID=159417 RepID=A0ABP0GCM0_CLALP